MRLPRFSAIMLLLLLSAVGHATVFATIHGVVHDAQHRPISNAQVTLIAAESAFTLKGTTARWMADVLRVQGLRL